MALLLLSFCDCGLHLIKNLQIRLSGRATYINNNGQLETDEFGPEIKTVVASTSDNRKSSFLENPLKTRFDFLKPNTNYTVEVCAVTRQKECGKVTISLK